MKDDVYYMLYPMLRYVLKSEQPYSILEISREETEYGKIFRNCINKEHTRKTRLDRICLGDSVLELGRELYDSILPKEILNSTATLNNYDFIFIKDLVEDMSPQQLIELIKQLHQKITRQVFIVTAEDNKDSMENCNPRLVYLQPYIYQFDYCYKGLKARNRSIHLFSIFPKVEYKEIGCDKKIQVKANIHPLNIAYVIPIKELTGGLKSNLGQIRELHRRGHCVTLYMKGTMERIIPEWSTLTDNDVDGQIVVPEDKHYLDYIKEADVIVLAGAIPIEEFQNSRIPIVLWEQGYGYLFGVYGKLIDSREEIHEKMRNIYRADIHILSVSNMVKNILKERFNRTTRIVPTFIDTKFYHPNKKENDIPIVLLVGNPTIVFKNLEDSIRVLRRVKKRFGEFKIKWICQVLPDYDVSDLDIEFQVMETQEKVAQLYREADILLSTSIIESFSLPPLEAMASGVAVLATDNIGIRTYGVSGENCIICEQGDIETLSEELIHLLEDKEYRTRLSIAGRESALDFSLERSIERMEKELCRIIANHVSK